MRVSNEELRSFGRRAFLVGSGAALTGLVCWRFEGGGSVVEAAGNHSAKQVTIVEFTDSGERKGVVTVPLMVKTDQEWKEQLPYASYMVARNAETERPFSGELLNVHDKGVFRCICCDSALFNANTKFESGTGWPSFWAPIAKQNVVEKRDLSLNMERVEVLCALCAAHTGHVFDDGPWPTHLRYCMNSVALRFATAS